MKNPPFLRRWSVLVAVLALFASACWCDMPSRRRPVLDEPPLPTPSCEMQWLSPTAGATLPNYGPYTLQWTPVAGAAQYVVWFALEGVAPDPLQNRSLSDTSLVIYLESHPEGGRWTFDVEAISPTGDSMCFATVTIYKAAYVPPERRPGGGGGQPTPCVSITSACP